MTRSFIRTLGVVILFLINIMTASGCINYADKEPFYYFPAIISIIIGIVFLWIDTKKNFLNKH